MNNLSDNVSVINTGTNTVVAIVDVGTFPDGVAVNPAGTFVYVANSSSTNVSVINAATNAVVAMVAVGSEPIGVAVNPAGTFVYVANEGSDNVSVINTATNTVTATVAVGSYPSAVGQFIGPAPAIPTTPAPPTGLLVLIGLALVLGWFAFKAAAAGKIMRR